LDHEKETGRKRAFSKKTIFLKLAKGLYWKMSCDENSAAFRRILTVDIEQEIIKINENKLERR
jgi:hypothetical protein